MGGQQAERFEPWLLHGVRRVQRWQHGHVATWTCLYVTVGRLPDGRWYVEHSRRGALAWAGERAELLARAEAARLMAADDREPWVEVPAEYDATGRPTSEGWVRRGGGWVRG